MNFNLKHLIMTVIKNFNLKHLIMVLKGNILKNFINMLVTFVKFLLKILLKLVFGVCKILSL